ncbi:glycosyltransferase [Mesorhizobium sp. B1-1-8]|uniref:glycosyltransferase n=1 Tax=Mesorhizobium sp. B1-1-8 TaxID=2589976 RepID=UPI001126660C|nr:glycosyltransferase [Mesorhizobium sp. B1-1-8]
MLREKIKISVVICTYNNSSLLDRTLECLSCQKNPGVPWEVLVVDNNCTDDTLLVANRHKTSNKIERLRIVSEARQGLTPARQRGVNETEGEWLAFVDDDCLLDQSWLINAICFADAHPSCGALGGIVRPKWEGGAEALPDSVGWALACQDHGSTACEIWGLVGAGIVLRRSALEQTGWTKRPLLADRIGNKLVSGGDTEISLRLLACGWEVWYTPQCVIDHIIPARRTSRSYLKRLSFGLGISQVLVDALTFENGFSACLAKSAKSALRQTVRALKDVIRDRMNGSDRRPSLIGLHFALGNWAGIGRLAFRRSLVGAVTRSLYASISNS